MKTYVISAVSADGNSVTVAECAKREYAEMIVAALLPEKPVQVATPDSLFKPGTAIMFSETEK